MDGPIRGRRGLAKPRDGVVVAVLVVFVFGAVDVAGLEVLPWDDEESGEVEGGKDFASERVIKGAATAMTRTGCLLLAAMLLPCS